MYGVDNMNSGGKYHRLDAHLSPLFNAEEGKPTLETSEDIKTTLETSEDVLYQVPCSVRCIQSRSKVTTYQEVSYLDEVQ